MAKRWGLITRSESKPARGKRSSGGSKNLPVDTLRKMGIKGVRDMNPAAENPNMKPTGSSEPLVYVLGEAPGKQEDVADEQFVGKSGKLLRGMFPDNYRKITRFNNVCRTRPPKNRTPLDKEIECFRPSLEKDIEKTQPRAVLAVGNVALKWFWPGAGGIRKNRGRRFPAKIGDHTFWVYPIHHPAYISRVQYDEKSDPPGPELKRAFKRDISKCFDELDDDPPEVYDLDELQARVNVVSTKAQIFDALDELDDSKVVTLDIETNQYRPFAKDSKILTIALGTDEKAFVFPYEHNEADLNDRQFKQVRKRLRKFFNNHITVCHNLKFELEWLLLKLGASMLDCRWRCTMEASYILDERRAGHSLDYLCRLHFGIDLKAYSNVDRKKLEYEPLNRVMNYNGLDVVATHALYRQTKKQLKREGLWQVYIDVQLPRVPALAAAQIRGLCVDDKVVHGLANQQTKQIDKLNKAIASLKAVKKYERKYGTFNPGSPEQVKILFRDVLGKKEGERKNGGYSVDKDALNAIGGELAESILELRKCNKMLSTYIKKLDRKERDSYVHEDGLVHTNFNTCFTLTGRLSSDEPNAQNYPKRDPELKVIRKAFVPHPGDLFLSVDYGQIEARGFGWASGDEQLVKSMWEGWDIHKHWADRIVSVYSKTVQKRYGSLDKEAMGRFRSDVKNQMVFPAFFGANFYYIASMLEMPPNKFEPLFEEFWQMHNGVQKWLNRTIKFYKRYGYVETLTGRRRRAPMSINQAVNMPIQGTASDVTVDAMSRLSAAAREREEPWLQPILNIHDDLLFSIPKDKDDYAIETVLDYMMEVPFDFINTPIQVEAEVGEENWYAMKELGKFESHTWRDN